MTQTRPNRGPLALALGVCGLGIIGGTGGRGASAPPAQMTAKPVAMKRTAAAKPAPAREIGRTPDGLPMGVLAPANLRARPVADKKTGKLTNVLTWTPLPGAAEYSVYQNDMYIGPSTRPIYMIPADMFRADQTVAVTAVAPDGSESRPSNIVSGRYLLDAKVLPDWAKGTPAPPEHVLARGEWNAGGPRIALSWQRGSESADVYRDGKLIARDLWGRMYLDAQVQPGRSYTYVVKSVFLPNPLRPTSAASAPATAQAPTGRPAACAGPPQILKIIPNDDGATVIFKPLPGAMDYRLYNAAHPGKVKYAGVRYDNSIHPQVAVEPLAIEWNGVNPKTGVTLVLEAVDKLGPFQKTHGSMTALVKPARVAPRYVQGAGVALTTRAGIEGSLNGQGDPSNVPIVLARSAPFHVDCRPRALSGRQVFFDTFRASKPFRLQPCPPRPPGQNVEFYGDPNVYQEYANDKWLVGVYGADPTVLPVFTISNHIHDVLADGGSASGNIPNHNNNASVTFTPLRSGKPRTFDISGGKVLHATFEVDAHFDSRRWCSLFVTPDEPLANPGKSAADGMDGRWPNVSGNCVLWEVQAERHKMTLLQAGQRSDLMQAASFNDEQSFGRIYWDHKTPRANGTTQDLDKRHRFDLYLSRNRFRLTERDAQGNLVVQREKEFPAGMTLPFERGRLWFAHEVYHTSNDHGDLITYNPEETYWINYRPWSDERHWDNMGQEVLNRFPVP